jgi:MFS transporter, DHA1 family, multidrug resistance protein
VRRFGFYLVLGGLSAFGPLSIDMYLPALPGLAHELSTSASQAQLTLTACLAGLGLGQLAIGPVSDRFGRRRPLFAGLAVYAAASLLCAAAQSIEVLVALRLLQGAAAAAGIVIARAIVRDVFDSTAMARVFALLMLVSGLAPILAPTLGAGLLRVTSWRGVFLTLGAIGALMLVGVVALLPETLPGDRRQTGGFAAVPRAMRELLGDRAFLGYLCTLGFAFGALFSYISGSPFVFQGYLDVSPQLYAAIFGLNGLGILCAAQVSRALVPRSSPRRLLGVGVAGMALGGLALLSVILAGGGLAAVVPSLFLAVASMGFVLPNATALALADHPQVAGTASGLLGVFQFLSGAVVAPLAGIAGKSSPYPMAVTIAVLALAAVAALRLMRARGLEPPRDFRPNGT